VIESKATRSMDPVERYKLRFTWQGEDNLLRHFGFLLQRRAAPARGNGRSNRVHR
jgi:hypothetical protein